jgi:hypothetical protein
MTAVLLLTSNMAVGQEFHLGGGYNGSNVNEAGDELWVGRAGYQFGAEVIFGKRWFLKTGIHLLVRNLDYTLANSDLDPGNPASTTEFQYTERNLKIPAHLGFRLLDPSDDPALNIYAFGGPSAVMNLSADLNNDALEVETTGTQWYIGFGGGLELGFLFVEAGYDIAMTNVFKGDDFETNPKVNNVFAVAGVRLRLAR